MSRRRWLHAVRVVGACGVLAVTGVAAAHATSDDRPRARLGSAALPTRVALERPRSTPTPRKVYVVGDSLTVGTEPWLRADLRRRGWTLTGVSARVGRPVSEGLTVLRAHRSALPGTVVIALGTNDFGADSKAVEAWLRTARAIVGHRRLVWVDLCLSPAADPQFASYRRVNAALKGYAPRFGVLVADWCAYASTHGVRPGPDGIHYTPSGYRKRAAFYARAVAATR